MGNLYTVRQVANSSDYVLYEVNPATVGNDLYAIDTATGAATLASPGWRQPTQPIRWACPSSPPLWCTSRRSRFRRRYPNRRALRSCW